MHGTVDHDRVTQNSLAATNSGKIDINSMIKAISDQYTPEQNKASMLNTLKGYTVEKRHMKLIMNPDGTFGHEINLKGINGLDAKIQVDLQMNLSEGPI